MSPPPAELVSRGCQTKDVFGKLKEKLEAVSSGFKRMKEQLDADQANTDEIMEQLEMMLAGVRQKSPSTNPSFLHRSVWRIFASGRKSCGNPFY